MADDDTDAGLREAIRQRNAFRDLLRSEGWDMLMKIFQEQLETRRNRIELNPLVSMDEAFAQQFERGEIANLRLTMQLPQSILDDAQSVIDTTKETEGHDEDG